MVQLCAEVDKGPEQTAAARDALELCTYQVSQQLVKAIHKVVVVAAPEAFASWPMYAAAFTMRGGVIEACASGATATLLNYWGRCGFAVMDPPMLGCAVSYYAGLCCAALRSAVLCCAVLCCAVLCCAVLCCSMIHCAILCCAVPSRVMLLYAVQGCATLHCTMSCFDAQCHALS